MKYFVSTLFIFAALTGISQVEKERVPSYFGIQVRPLFSTNFLGDRTLELSEDGFETTISQRLGYSFGGTVRAGLTKLLALETGINFTQRNFTLTMAIPDSNSFATDSMAFIEYDIPLNALFYIQLSKKFFMNASLGASILYKPTDVGIFNQPGGHHRYTHTGLTRSKLGFGLNANVGFEFRTEKAGFFYLGGSARVPFTPLFDLVADWQYQGKFKRMIGEVDGSFLAIDFKYFFPQIKNKGPQLLRGPIE